MSNIGKIIRVNVLPPQGERETNVIYQVAAPGAATYTDYAIDENGDMKTPAADSAAQNLSDDIVKISNPDLVSEGFLTQAQFNQNINEELDHKLNIPLIDGSTQDFTQIVGLDANGNTAKLPAGDLGRNVANSPLTTVPGAGLTLGANWTLNTSGLYYSVTGLADVSSDTTFNMLLAQNASGRLGKSNGKGAFISLPNQLTESEKTTWKTVMNGGWTTATMSVFLINPIVVDNANNNKYVSLIGANLNFNPASFSVTICDINGAHIATVPNSQVNINNTTGQNLTFYFNFSNIPAGTYKIKLWNGVATYISGVTFKVASSLDNIDLSGVTWNVLNYGGNINDNIISNNTLFSTDATLKDSGGNSINFPNTGTVVTTGLSSQICTMMDNFVIEVAVFFDNDPAVFDSFGGLCTDTLNSLANTLISGAAVQRNSFKNLLGQTIPGASYSNAQRMIFQKSENILTTVLYTNSGSISSISNVNIDNSPIKLKAIRTCYDTIGSSLYNARFLNLQIISAYKF
ncbi:hypothetical protein [Chryseobacterium lathyri]|uniref:hypothetical protein n=1 Tax=Chryseobacterium lathyri TaxID=395933 RepID=UPI002781149F|nr:hypothetical protein [Chryseobacterium lathyri]MDQ0066688.1 hypothetical protein [Chryseobacterium lathyri]